MRNDWNTNWILNELTIYGSCVCCVESYIAGCRKSFTFVTFVTHVLSSKQQTQTTSESWQLIKIRESCFYIPGKCKRKIKSFKLIKMFSIKATKHKSI